MKLEIFLRNLLSWYVCPLHVLHCKQTPTGGPTASSASEPMMGLLPCRQVSHWLLSGQAVKATANLRLASKTVLSIWVSRKLPQKCHGVPHQGTRYNFSSPPPTRLCFQWIFISLLILDSRSSQVLILTSKLLYTHFSLPSSWWVLVLPQMIPPCTSYPWSPPTPQPRT